MAVKCPSAIVFRRRIDVFSNLGDDGGAKGDVGNKVAVPISRSSRSVLPPIQRLVRLRNVHDVYVQPVGALVHGTRALFAHASEIAGQNGRRNDGVRSHDVALVVIFSRFKKKGHTLANQNKNRQVVGKI